MLCEDFFEVRTMKQNLKDIIMEKLCSSKLYLNKCKNGLYGKPLVRFNGRLLSQEEAIHTFIDNPVQIIISNNLDYQPKDWINIEIQTYGEL